MFIPHLGDCERSDAGDYYTSAPIAVPVLGGKLCEITLEEYEEDENPEDFHTAIGNFLSINTLVLKQAEPHIYRYYLDCNSELEPGDDFYLEIPEPSDVWEYLDLDDEPTVTRRAYGDHGVYVSLSCRCDWEVEHGLQIVLKNGLTITKVGAFDGHLTNADAYDDESLEGVVYHRL